MNLSLELLFMSIAMFVGCYLAGRLPLCIQNGNGKIQDLMSTFGAGLLVGTAFTVIIPEGIRTLFIPCFQAEDSSSKTPPKENIDGKTSILDTPQVHHHTDNELVIALSLLTGFLFMLFVDKFSSSGNFHYSAVKGDLENNAGGLISSRKSRRVCTATLGLVVHAAADGIALGAAAASHHTDVEFIVFFAIMLHKAPTAFGLTSFLIKEGVDSKGINRFLLFFSVAAPIGAILTCILVDVFGSSSMSNSVNTSVAMLFSAGTFLYVATVHILPEIMTSTSPDQDAPGHLSCLQLIFLILGAFIPLLFNLGHHH